MFSIILTIMVIFGTVMIPGKKAETEGIRVPASGIRVSCVQTYGDVLRSEAVTRCSWVSSLIFNGRDQYA